MRHFDYVIVGGGAAGCVLANRLSADPARSVILIEAGPPKDSLHVRIPAAFPKLFRTDRDWNYMSVPQESLAGRQVYLPRGRMLGGSSAMNAQMFQWCAREDYDAWAGPNSDWSYARLKPYFERATGPNGLSVERRAYLHPLSKAFIEACSHCAIELRDSIEAEDMAGVAAVPVMHKRASRCSAARAYIQPVLHRPNLTVECDALVTHIHVERGIATGVTVLRGTNREEIRATREVILCGGAFNTPQLLMLSGIGPAEHLKSKGIPIVHALEGVGRNYQDHAVVGLRYRTLQPISMASAETLANLLQFLVLHRGPMTSNLAEVYAFIKSTMEMPTSDIELIFCPAIFDTSQTSTDHGFSIGVIHLTPQSVGTVQLATNDPHDAPEIDLRFFTEAADLSAMRTGIEMALRLAQSPPLAQFAGGFIEWNGAPDPITDPDGYARGVAETLFHPVGTCKMGTDAASVVDCDLRVHGIEKLRIVDASVIPQVPRGHPQAVITVLAERAADLIKNES
ncbi:MAG: choline dehydrogenase [Candidatus Hydrogenedentota bacterium]